MSMSFVAFFPSDSLAARRGADTCTCRTVTRFVEAGGLDGPAVCLAGSAAAVEIPLRACTDLKQAAHGLAARRVGSMMDDPTQYTI